MKIKIYIDSNAWDILYEQKVNLDEELNEFDLCIMVRPQEVKRRILRAYGCGGGFFFRGRVVLRRHVLSINVRVTERDI